MSLIYFLAFSGKNAEDAEYVVHVLARCAVKREIGEKKSMKVVSHNENGEPVVISLPLSQVMITWKSFVVINYHICNYYHICKQLSVSSYSCCFLE